MINMRKQKNNGYLGHKSFCYFGMLNVANIVFTSPKREDLRRVLSI